MLDTTTYTKYIHEATKTLKQQGFSVRWGNDFDVFRRILSRHDERYEPSNGFNPDYYEDGELDGVWLVAYRGTSELVHTQASRRVSVGTSMRQHLLTRANDYEPAYLKFDLNNLDVNISPDASQITGDAIYHGEAWLKGGPTGIRGGSALYIFSRMMMAKTFFLWDVEHIFGLITPFTGIKGLPQRYGYMRCEQGAITFVDKTTLPNDLWLVWMTAAEAQHQLRLSPGYFHEMVESSRQGAVGKVA